MPFGVAMKKSRVSQLAIFHDISDVMCHALLHVVDSNDPR